LVDGSFQSECIEKYENRDIPQPCGIIVCQTTERLWTIYPSFTALPYQFFVRKKPNVIVIVLFMSVLWGFYLYPEQHPPRWSLILLSLAIAVGFAGYVLYCLSKRKVFNGIAPFRGEWIYRDEDSLLYWLYIVFFSFYSGVGIYTAFALLTKGSL
jgi:hypothetical protein